MRFAFGLIALGLLMTPCLAEKADKADPDKLVGTWTYVSGVKDGKKMSGDDLSKGTVEITKENITLKSPDGEFVIKYKVDDSKKPWTVSMEITKGPQGEGMKSTGIISLSGDKLKLCYPPMGGDTPKDFESKEGSQLHYFVLKRKK